jgi:hypothetical protein
MVFDRMLKNGIDTYFVISKMLKWRDHPRRNRLSVPVFQQTSNAELSAPVYTF